MFLEKRNGTELVWCERGIAQESREEQREQNGENRRKAGREDKPAKDDLHPTMKPVGLFKKQIRNSSRQGDLVLDLFAGSGTAIVAAEEMNRRCYSMEYDPVYAEVIIQRWEEQTGKTATRVEA